MQTHLGMGLQAFDHEIERAAEVALRNAHHAGLDLGQDQ